MSEPRAFETGSASQARGVTMTTEQIEIILADFRQWLSNTADVAPVSEPPRIDLITLLNQFTALRQEVNLQTKASRTANDHFAEAMKLYANPPKPADPDAEVRPLVKVLVDIADALQTASSQLDRTKQHLIATLEELETQPDSWPDPPAEVETPGPSFFANLFGLATPLNHNLEWRTWSDELQQQRQEQALQLDRLCEHLRDLVNGISDGYTMSLRRVERAWPALDIVPIPCVGLPFDPETMEAVELVDGSPSGHVVEEVRRGYRWHGKLFRFAQVKVAR